MLCISSVSLVGFTICGRLTFQYAHQILGATASHRPAAGLMTERRQWVATMILLVWVKLMNPLQAVFQDFFLLVKMIALMIGTLGHQPGGPVFPTSLFNLLPSLKLALLMELLDPSDFCRWMGPVLFAPPPPPGGAIIASPGFNSKFA